MSSSRRCSSSGKNSNAALIEDAPGAGRKPRRELAATTEYKSVVEAEVNLPWLLACKALINRIARHCKCTSEDAKLRVIRKGKAGRLGARGQIAETSNIRHVSALSKPPPLHPVAPLASAWHGVTDLDLGSLLSGEITNLELCYIDLIREGLLPMPAERVRRPAAEAIAYRVKGVPLPWKEWQCAGASQAELEQAEIDLGEFISAEGPAWGKLAPGARAKRIPACDFRPNMLNTRYPRCVHQR
jgi:hypothetical protein